MHRRRRRAVAGVLTRIVRRVTFAAPFVLVVGCKKPIAAPISLDDEPPQRSTLPLNAGTAAVDAAPNDAAVPIDAAVRSEAPVPTDAVRAAKAMPALDCGERGVTCHPPRPMRLHVVDVTVQGAELIVKLDAGTEQGITRDWRGCVAKTPTSDACADDGDVVFLRVDRRATLVKIHMLDGQLERSRTVKVWAP